MAMFSKEVTPSNIQVYTSGVATKVGTVVLATYAIRMLDAVARMAAGGVVSLFAKRKAAKKAAPVKAKAEASTQNPGSVDPALFEVDPDIVGALLKRSEEVASQEATSNG